MGTKSELASQKKYRNSEKGREASRKHRATNRFKLKSRLRMRRYVLSEHGRKLRRLQRKIYLSSEKGMMVSRASRIKRNLRPMAVFRVYQRGAKSRSLCFDISFDQFLTFWGKPCFYCGSSIETAGLDRVDNSVGYILSNLVSCCRICNHMKRSWSKEFFVEHARKISSNSATPGFPVKKDRPLVQ